MAVSDYSSLKQYAINRIARDDYTDTEAAEDVAFSEAVFNRFLRVKRGLSTIQTLSMVAGTRDYSFSSDFLKLDNIGYTDNGNLSQITMGQLVGFPTQGLSKPYNYAVQNKTISFYPTPASNYSVQYAYIAKLPALSASQTTNWLLTDYPDVYSDAVLYHAYKRFRDARAVDYKTIMEQGIQGIEDADKEDNLSNSGLVMQHNVSDGV